MKTTASVLSESFPYIRKFKGKLVVVKVGGSVLYGSELKEQLAQDLCFLSEVGISVVVVHGGGKEVTEALEKANRPTKFIDGYRYTSEDDIELIEMIFSGKISKEIVSLIVQAGGDAVSLSGRDSALLRLERLFAKNGEDLGKVGRVVSVNKKILEVLISEKFIPVVSSIGSFFDGTSGNINADEVASSIASAMGALKLIYLSDVDGLILDDNLVVEADLKEAESLINNPQVTDGMRPKLEFAVSALKNGVQEVHFVNGKTPHSLLIELFTDEGIGSKFSYSRRKKN
jgi:acetylglutamate kinase